MKHTNSLKIIDKKGVDILKCIKDKCKYCDTHNFYYSFYSCHIGGSFEKDNDNVSCVIDGEIEDIEHKLEEIKKYRDFIKKSQK